MLGQAKMRMLCALKIVIWALLLLGVQTFAQTTKEKTPLPPRTDPVPRIDGYGPYKFGMSIEQAKEAGPNAEKTDCSRLYVGFAYCLTQSTQLFGQDATIDAMFDINTRKLSQINIMFDRRDGKEGACQKVWETIVRPFFQRWGIPTRKQGTVNIWESPYGGEVSLAPLCFNESAGLVMIVYKDTHGF